MDEKVRLVLFSTAAAVFSLVQRANAATQELPTLSHSLSYPGTNYGGGRQGWSVAVDGDFAVAGAPWNAVNGFIGGVVRVYDTTTGALRYILNNPTSEDDDAFGYSVAISGTRVVVGARYDYAREYQAGIAYVYDLSGAAPTNPIVTLTNPTPVIRDYFGTSVSISGTRVVVGAPNHDVRPSYGPLDVGAAYVFNLASSSPSVPERILENPNRGISDYFGSAVAISGTRIVIGAYASDVGATNAGIAFVYELNGGYLTLTNPAPAIENNFGAAVAVSGTRVVIGAQFGDLGATNGGNAYIYDLASATPTLPVLALVNPATTRTEFTYFGSAVAISGTSVVVGASRDYTGANGAGSAYVYDVSGSSPTVPVVILNPPDPRAWDMFGNSVSISSTRVMIGVPGANQVFPVPGGTAYLYDLASPSMTTPTATLNSLTRVFSDHFGTAVSVSGTRVVVGGDEIRADERIFVYDLANATPTASVARLPKPARGAYFASANSVAISGPRIVAADYLDSTWASYAGAAYVYNLESGSLNNPLILTNPTAKHSHYGSSVAMSGTRVVIGAPTDGTWPRDAGAVYLYDVAASTPAVPVAVLQAPTPQIGAGFGQAVAISDQRIVVGAPGHDPGGISALNNAGIAYVFTLGNSIPTILTNPYPSQWYTLYFGESVAIDGSFVAVGAPGRDGYGKVFVYNIEGPSGTAHVLQLSDTNVWSRTSFGWSLAISGRWLVVGAPANEGAAFVYDLANLSFAPVASLTNPAPSYRGYFGYSVAIDDSTIVVSAPGTGDEHVTNRPAAYVYTPVRPKLRIDPADPGWASISWTASTNYILQFTDQLPPTNWINSPSGTANPVTISTTNRSRFHRLFRP